MYKAKISGTLLVNGRTVGCDAVLAEIRTPIAGMRGGLPVVSVCGLLTSSSLEHGKNIIFADFENVAQLERVLKPLVEDSDMRRRIGENARMLVQNISWADTCAQYEFLLNS